MKTRAAVAWKAGAPLTIETVDLEGPKAGEVLVEIKATGICHTDYYTLSGADPEGLFPAILGHEGAGVVVDVGPGVSTLPQVIFGYARRGINPTIYAAATLLITTVTIVIVGYSVWVARQTRKREREIAAATRAETKALVAS